MRQRRCIGTYAALARVRQRRWLCRRKQQAALTLTLTPTSSRSLRYITLYARHRPAGGRRRGMPSSPPGFLNAQRTAFFPLVLTENWSKGMRKIKCACLQPRGNGIYTVDPRWKGDSNKAADKATIAIIFEVMGEGLRQMPDGFEGEPAWKLTTVRRQ